MPRQNYYLLFVAVVSNSNYSYRTLATSCAWLQQQQSEFDPEHIKHALTLAHNQPLVAVELLAADGLKQHRELLDKINKLSRDELDVPGLAEYCLALPVEQVLAWLQTCLIDINRLNVGENVDNAGLITPIAQKLSVRALLSVI